MVLLLAVLYLGYSPQEVSKGDIVRQKSNLCQLNQEDAPQEEVDIKNVILLYGKDVPEKTAEEWALLIKLSANKHNIDPVWITAMIYHESCFDTYAVSKCNARGLMQIMPETASALGVEDSDELFNPHVNIETGVRYLAYLQDKWNTDLDMATIAYNQGESIFNKGHTETYLITIKSYYAEMSQL